ncbi:Qc-snare protein, SFT1 family [Dunaliella salina]|uniref:Qc-snare protein, SFT1 family n=1 Tax=Dunaliella salina TaxID=3046 RepID=A0ABQ7GYZ3_DUNSA|nr:Qc-snare protein, SFT1 family [Dunaliella salina]|eukprot:KAF5839831.1 Qc-snare protein, SFT1 family [Dunaliella salina]
MHSRGGLSARSHAADREQQVQINIGDKFDFDAEVEGLSAQVRGIKQMSLAIDEERRQQGDIMSTLEDTMERSRLRLRRARQRLSSATKQAKSNHWLVLTLFVVAVCLSVYFLSRLYRLGRLVLG